MNGRLLSLIVLTGLTFSAAAAQDASSAPSKIDIKHVYAPGSNLSLVYRVIEETAGEGDVGGNMKFSSVMTIALSAKKGDVAGQTELDMNFKRIQALLQAGELNRDVDSSKPESLLPGMPLDVLTNVTFTAGLDASGNITTFSGSETFMEKAKMVPQDAKEKQNLTASIDAGLRQLLAEPFVYLPTTPVAIGDSWTLKRKVYGLPIMGTKRASEEDLTCRLANIRKIAKGRVAVIEISGKSTVIEGGTPTDPKVTQKTGQVEYNFDTGELISHRISLSGSGKMAMPEGKEVRFAKKVYVETTLSPADQPDSAKASMTSGG